MDLLKVTETVLLTDTSVVPSAGEIAVTVGADVSLLAEVDSSSSSLLEQEKERAKTNSRVINWIQTLSNFRSTKPPFYEIQNVTPIPS
ncbi:MAG: hypothetical protein MAG581_01293 [Deltaproteobacteria bacterium]|jgi:hypothetical protein|nr:hypothetical protein [Deltaproteobacteria bacterium]